MTRFPLIVIVLLSTPSIIFVSGIQTSKLENPPIRSDQRVPHRLTTQPLEPSRESFMQRILAKIQGQGSTAPQPVTTVTRPNQPNAVQPLVYNYYQPPGPHFVYRYPMMPPPYVRQEKSELENSQGSNPVSNNATEAPTQATTTIEPTAPPSTEKSTPVPRFHRGRSQKSESDSISIPILRSDALVNNAEQDRKVVQKSSEAPKCYLSQKSYVPLPPMPLPLYNNFGYGFPFGYQHLQPHVSPGPYGNPLVPLAAPQTRYPIIYFVLPKIEENLAFQKQPMNKEPFDLIAMEENKVVSAPVPKPHTEVASESSQKETVESFSPKPAPTAESSMEEIVEIDVDPVSKLLDLMTGSSHSSSGEGKEDKDLVSLPSLKPIEKNIIPPGSKAPENVSHHLKTVDESETKESINATTAAPRQRIRKFKFSK